MILIIELQNKFNIKITLHTTNNIMKILIIAETSHELKAIKQWIKSANLKKKLNIDFLCCWIWTNNIIYSLEHYLTKNPEPTFLRNIWICNHDNKENKKEFAPIQISNIINCLTWEEIIIPPYLKIAPLKTCFATECLLTEENSKLRKNNWEKYNEKYFDIESRWIEFIASRHKLPHIILRVPLSWEKDKSTKDKEKTAHTDILKNLPYHDYLEKIIGRIDQNE